ncbi:MAG TPA: response regulator transcription factor [Solirubrobacterales bacterium]|jgi:DNA-binding NarL/FixJ family response regulator
MCAHLRSVPDLAGSDPSRRSASSITVVLADAHALTRRGLRQLLEGAEGIEVIAEANDLASTMHHVRDKKPNVLALDLRMSEDAREVLIGALRELTLDTRVVVLTMQESPKFAQRALADGALGIVRKEHADYELPQAVRAVAGGEIYVSPQIGGGRGLR